MKRTTHFLNRFVLQQSAHTPARTNSQIPFKEAVVIIPLIQRNDEWFVLFTQRSWQLRHHPGQICFPGGKKDASDASLQMAGLREMEEELGISAEQIHLMGKLASGQTLSGYQIHPYLAILQQPVEYFPSKDEVAAVFELSLESLLDIGNYHLLIIQRNEKSHKIIGLTVDGWFIWGATAKMLYQLAKQYG